MDSYPWFAKGLYPEKAEPPLTEDIDVNEVIRQVEELGPRGKISDIEGKDSDTVKGICGIVSLNQEVIRHGT